MQPFLRNLLVALCTVSSPVLAFDQSDSTRLSNILNQAANIYLSYPDSAITLANSIATESMSGNHKYLLGHSYFVLSKANWAKANYRLSIEYGFKALKIFENSSYTHLWGQSLLSLARTSLELRDFTQANDFLKRSRQLAITHDDNKLLADTYRERSMLLSETQLYDSSLYFIDIGLLLYKGMHDTLNTSILYSRKVKIYHLLGNYKKSTTYNRLALHLDSVVGNKRALGISFLYAAQNANELHQSDSAIFFAKKSIELSGSLKNLSGLIKAHTLLADIYSKTNKPDLAVHQLKLANQYKDSLYNSEKNAQIQEMKSLYELGTKDKTIEELGQKNTLQQQLISNQRWLTVLLAAGIILLMGFIMVLSRLRSIQTKTNQTLEEKNQAIELQREEMQAQAEYLHYLNQLKSKLFSVISHDLRGPIATLQSLLDLVTSKIMTQEEFLSVSDKVKGNLNVTQRTLDNLLNWSLSQMEGIRTEKKALNIKVCIDEASKLLTDIAEQKRIYIANTTEEAIKVWADPNQLQLILRNLIHNAVKFSKAEGHVEIFASTSNNYCSVTVKDSGIGMTEEEVNMILGQEHFTKRGTQQEKGTGLGLLLCKEFIKHNGGELSIKSKQGHGTEISFTLALAL
ncbi:sensor histidine kinase [Ohtaekwangia koreensis]|uniref:histidine kinase n=1 Tax=Ohtaekwangia koreensis TaxID=688867 RepID=A0A1T5L6D8_9BACT|nr:HAMP domain-containing sensor histidine kinase [Ohtaekwangia koreensis]SKC71617.1 Signal transduction histidine kinase [Ohtaekwangia koreensis]